LVVEIPIIFSGLYKNMPFGAGFLPSTVGTQKKTLPI